MAMENIKCIICGIENNQIAIEENGYAGRKCEKCGLIYISPRPTFANISEMYDGEKANVAAKSNISSAFIKRLYAKHNIRIVKKYVKSGTVLEIGAGAGYFLEQARNNDFEVCGIEFNRIEADFIRNAFGIQCEGSSLDVSLFGGKKFDLIYHCDVLSHFYDPVMEFQKINKMLKENGFVIFETGNFGDVERKYYRLIDRFQYPEHLFLFQRKKYQGIAYAVGV